MNICKAPIRLYLKYVPLGSSRGDDEVSNRHHTFNQETVPLFGLPRRLFLCFIPTHKGTYFAVRAAAVVIVVAVVVAVLLMVVVVGG